VRHDPPLAGRTSTPLLLAKEAQFTTATGAQARCAMRMACRCVRSRSGASEATRATLCAPIPASARLPTSAGAALASSQASSPQLRAMRRRCRAHDRGRRPGVGFDPRVFVQGAVDIYPCVPGTSRSRSARPAPRSQRSTRPISASRRSASLYLAHADVVRDDPVLVRVSARNAARRAARRRAARTTVCRRH
jgi:hypothetical protein